uniref:Uncharacterized protein n=1 Tax=Saimiri boliviensis boliviensis TaxID=39432 RepID=A0A2K6TJG0_SAIBB
MRNKQRMENSNLDLSHYKGHTVDHYNVLVLVVKMRPTIICYLSLCVCVCVCVCVCLSVCLSKFQNCSSTDSSS